MKKNLLLLFILQVILITAQSVTDSKGKKQGYWKKKDDKDKIIYEGAFKDDKPVGRFKYYYPNDSIRAIINFKAGGKIAYAKLFHFTGKPMAEGKYVNEETKDSTWIYYDESGTLISRDTYKIGKKHGPSFVYLQDGTISEETNFKDGLEDGAFKKYFDGKAVKSVGKYVKGQLEGKVTYYYPNGTEVATGFYKNGQKVGPWIYKTESGKMREKELYKNGKLASKKETGEFFSKTKAPENKATEP